MVTMLSVNNIDASAVQCEKASLPTVATWLPANDTDRSPAQPLKALVGTSIQLSGMTKPPFESMKSLFCSRHPAAHTLQPAGGATRRRRCRCGCQRAEQWAAWRRVASPAASDTPSVLEASLITRPSRNWAGTLLGTAGGGSRAQFCAVTVSARAVSGLLRRARGSARTEARAWGTRGCRRRTQSLTRHVLHRRRCVLAEEGGCRPGAPGPRVAQLSRDQSSPTKFGTGTLGDGTRSYTAGRTRDGEIERGAMQSRQRRGAAMHRRADKNRQPRKTPLMCVGFRVWDMGYGCTASAGPAGPTSTFTGGSGLSRGVQHSPGREQD